MNDQRQLILDFLNNIISRSIVIECADHDSAKDALNEQAHFHYCHELRFILPAANHSGSFARAILYPCFVKHNPVAGDELKRCMSLWIEPNSINCNIQASSQVITIAGAKLEHYSVQVASLFEWLKDFSEKRPLYNGKVFHTHLNNLLHSLCSAIALELNDTTVDKNSSVPTLVDNLIRINYSDPELSVNSIARSLQMNVNYLSGLYKKSCGHNICTAIIDFRLEQALAMLRTGRYLVKDAAFMCGFRNQYYFSNAFRKKYHVPPSQYAQLNSAVIDVEGEAAQSSF